MAPLGDGTRVTARTALVTMLHGPAFEAVTKVTLPLFEAAAARLGWDLIVATPPASEEQIPPHWHKPEALLQALETHERALWLDGDSVITCADPLERVPRGASMAFGHDDRLPHGVHTAAWFVTATEPVREFLHEVSAARWSSRGRAEWRSPPPAYWPPLPYGDQEAAAEVLQRTRELRFETALIPDWTGDAVAHAGYNAGMCPSLRAPYLSAASSESDPSNDALG